MKEPTKQEREQAARQTQSIVEQMKRKSGVTTQQPGETEEQFKQRIGSRSPYKRDESGAPRQAFTGKAPMGEHRQ
jgi:hypothetical protein